MAGIIGINDADVRRGHDKTNSDQTWSKDTLGSRLHSYTVRRDCHFVLAAQRVKALSAPV